MSNTQLKTLEIPTIRNIREARTLCHEYGSVLTVGPDKSEVANFSHPDHKIVSFGDVSDPDHYNAPRLSQVLDAVSWGIGRENLLVHCHAGISRSTAIAWGVAIGNGIEPKKAYLALADAHPMELEWTRPVRRPFSPNRLIVKHLEQMYGFTQGELTAIVKKHDRWY